MNKKLYLSGSIEFSKDAASWRNWMEKELYKLYEIVNPASQYCPLEKDTEDYKKWTYNRFVIPDIQDVLKCSHFFVKVDKGASRGSGTWSELTFAAYFNKHIVYFLDDIKLTEIPGWSLGCLANGIQVQSIEEAIKYYKDLKI